MKDDVTVAIRQDEPAPAQAGRFDQTSIALHWLTVVLVVAQFTMAWLVGSVGASAPAMLTAHRSAGLLLWAVVVARLIWRRRFAHLPPFPASIPRTASAVAVGYRPAGNFVAGVLASSRRMTAN